MHGNFGNDGIGGFEFTSLNYSEIVLHGGMCMNEKLHKNLRKEISVFRGILPTTLIKEWLMVETKIIICLFVCLVLWLNEYILLRIWNI